eukprot:TRINITY_DN76872_c0_g1_i1.p1 TRINITY_DN76872_c0_g1~~TRINITY_DN76872_c0_g1_i1.p1  ORF type:complete len:359 (-),score=85.68 TRINITY_DN76872_c0_g1_i1:143-1141(-)
MTAIDGNAVEAASVPQVLSDLHVIDDHFREMWTQCEKESQTLARQIKEKQRPLLEERAKLLACSDNNSDSNGTPAIKGFWATALRNHPDVRDMIQDWDLPVLQYLKDVTTNDLDNENSDKGFSVTFHFSENPYFDHQELGKEYHTEETPYTSQIHLTATKATAIMWKTGMDISVETVKKKASKSSKKTKGASETRGRPSFFRSFFRTYKPNDDLPSDLELLVPGDLADEDDDEELADMFFGMDHEAGTSIRDYVIPYAARWYTGEAAPEEHDEDEDEESEEEVESDSDDSPASRGKDKGKRGFVAPKKDASKKRHEGGDVDDAAKKEECKQQ